MFSLSNIIKIYIILSIVIMVSFFVMLTSIDVVFEPIWAIISPEVHRIYQELYITVIIMSLIGVVIGIIISIFGYSRGINKYKDLLRRFDNLEQVSVIRPSILRFPNQDEFGNLGQMLNNFIDRIDYYDQLKTHLAKIENTKFSHISDFLPYPLLVINMNTNQPFISFYNHAFRDIFLKKSVFIDNFGKTQTQYYSIDNLPLNAFTIKSDTQDNFFSKQQLSQIHQYSINGEKRHSLYDVTYSELSGNRKYCFQEVISIPVYNEIDNSISQVVFVFLGGTLVEKEKKVLAEEAIETDLSS